jgi:hypothetical protein
MKKKNPKNNKSTSTAPFWLWASIALTTGACGGILILFWHSPAAYRPIQPDNPQQVSLYLTHQLGPEFVNQVQLDEPFELLIEQAGLNDIISRWPWPQQFSQVSFADPVVVFQDQSILVMGTLKYKGIPSVLSITAVPTMNEQRQVCLNIQSIRLGVLPVTTFVSKLAQNVFDNNLHYFEQEPDLERTVRAIIENEYFNPVFWFFDKRVKMTDFTIERGLLKLTLAPEPE